MSEKDSSSVGSVPAFLRWPRLGEVEIRRSQQLGLSDARQSGKDYKTWNILSCFLRHIASRWIRVKPALLQDACMSDSGLAWSSSVPPPLQPNIFPICPICPSHGLSHISSYTVNLSHMSIIVCSINFL